MTETAKARKELYHDIKPNEEVPWGRGEFFVYKCRNVYKEDSECVHSICRYCGEGIEYELERKPNEKRNAFRERCEKVENQYEATEEKEEGCNHRWTDLERMEKHYKRWWDKKKGEVGTKCALCCIGCGRKI